MVISYCLGFWAKHGASASTLIAGIGGFCWGLIECVWPDPQSSLTCIGGLIFPNGPFRSDTFTNGTWPSCPNLVFPDVFYPSITLPDLILPNATWPACPSYPNIIWSSVVCPDLPCPNIIFPNIICSGARPDVQPTVPSPDLSSAAQKRQIAYLTIKLEIAERSLNEYCEKPAEPTAGNLWVNWGLRECRGWRTCGRLLLLLLFSVVSLQGISYTCKTII